MGRRVGLYGLWGFGERGIRGALKEREAKPGEIKKDKYMNWDQIEGKWKQFAGPARERWGKLTEDDIQTLTGQKDHLVGKIQERYGIARAEAEKQAEAWSLALKEK